MDIGPVEYLILGFPGNMFTGQIVPELAKLIDSGLVRIIDLTFIMKDADGAVQVVEYDAVEELAAFAGLDAEVGGILTDEDVAYAAEALEPNTSAALLIWEDTWATPFAVAVRNANGVILEGARIPREIIEEAVGALNRRPGLRQETIDMPLRRRRPIARMATTAVVAGTAAHMGAKSAQRSAAAAQDQAPPPDPAPAYEAAAPHPKPRHRKLSTASRSTCSSSLPPSRTRASSPKRSSPPRRHRSWGSNPV